MNDKILLLNPEFCKNESWALPESISEEDYLRIAQRSTPKSRKEVGQCSQEENSIFLRVGQLRAIQKDTKPSEPIILTKDSIIEPIGIYDMDEGSMNTYNLLESPEAHVIVSYDSNHCGHYFLLMFTASERNNPEAFCSKRMYQLGSNEHRIGTNNFICFRINKDIVDNLKKSNHFTYLEYYASNNDFVGIEMEDWWYKEGGHQSYDNGSGQSDYCEACGQSPCMCSDREQTSTTHEW